MDRGGLPQQVGASEARSGNFEKPPPREIRTIEERLVVMRILVREFFGRVLEVFIRVVDFVWHLGPSPSN